MTVLCPNGHVSEEPDYCSVCGAAVKGAGALPAPSRSPSATPGAQNLRAGPARPPQCPACGEPREPLDARFCEVCRYDFVKNRPGPPPVARPPPPPQPAVAPVPFAPANGWELVIAVDPSLDTEPDAESPCPAGVPERVVALRSADLLVGRHDDTRDIHPEISLHDPGASRRHAKFVLDPDGGVALQDLASTNGTEVNGAAVPPGTRRKLAEGDSVTLGRWTRITLRGRP
jgi:hypothetical protein